MCECFCLHVCKCIICAPEIRRRYQIPRNWSHGWLWATMWVLRTNPRSSAETVSALTAESSSWEHTTKPYSAHIHYCVVIAHTYPQSCDTSLRPASATQGDLVSSTKCSVPRKPWLPTALRPFVDSKFFLWPHVSIVLLGTICSRLIHVTVHSQNFLPL